MKYNRSVLVSSLLAVLLLVLVSGATPPVQGDVGLVPSSVDGRFCDQFAGSPLDPRWTWSDPDGNCSTDLTSNPHALRIHAPIGSWHDLWSNDAPHIVQQVTGDFVAKTKVAVTVLGTWDPTAGILVWQDTDNYIGIEVGEAPRIIGMRAKLAGVSHVVDSGTYGFNSAFLKMTRTGDSFVGAYSLDGVTWHTITTLTYPANETLSIGLYLTNLGVGANGVYDYFEIDDCAELALGRRVLTRVYPPVTAPSGRFPVKWQIKGGTSVSETYIMWDTSGHEYLNDYAYQTLAQSGGMGLYETHIEVPEGADAVYFKPYAVVDGEIVYGDREYIVPTTYALNVGGDLYGLDTSRQYWNPDRESDFSPVWYEFWGDDRYSVERPIANTEDDWIYQSQRQGMSSFSAWLSPDVYEMTLEVAFHFAELEATGPGQRVFDIYLERGTPNEVALHDVDVYDLAGGQDIATALTTTVTAVIIPGVDEHLNIEFESAGDTPILNGLVLRGLHAVPQYHVTRKVGAGADDTYTDGLGTHLTDDQILLGGNSEYHGGFRFPALHMPQSAVIRSASLEVTAAQVAYWDTTLDIYAHAHDSSPSFEWQAVVPNRPRTVHYVPWDLSDTDWTYNRRYVSPDIVPVIQEVVRSWRAERTARGMVLRGIVCRAGFVVGVLL